uniref:Uncharacterized protein n=1 Tax=Opuntia streptacantha TaxID=393608 RepID=A0A7C9FM87_OPUST
MLTRGTVLWRIEKVGQQVHMSNLNCSQSDQRHRQRQIGHLKEERGHASDPCKHSIHQRRPISHALYCSGHPLWQMHAAPQQQAHGQLMLQIHSTSSGSKVHPFLLLSNQEVQEELQQVQP